MTVRNKRHATAPTVVGEFLRVEVGSTLHGISVGNDDLDMMGVCCEPPDHVIGLQLFEQKVWRSAAVREGRQDAKSQPGDTDLVVYSLRKWARLALKGNPTVLLLLFAPPEKMFINTVRGHELQAMAPYFVSRRAGDAFAGYLHQQRQRLLRERGTAHVPNRGDKDAKYAAHMVRLGFQGRELLTTGRLTLPMPTNERNVCLEVRTGELDLDHALNITGRLEREIKDLSTDGPLQENPDEAAVDDFLVETYRKAWASVGVKSVL